MDDGGLVLLCEHTGKLHRCNPTAAAMWAALVDHNGQTNAAVLAVAEQYGMDESRVRTDLDALLGDLRSAGLVRIEQ
jgi:hypothetical protein